MSGTVPMTRPTVGSTGARFASPVRSYDWQGIGALANHVRGRGAVLVPHHLIAEQIPSGTNTGTYRYRVFTNPFAMQRAYYVELRSSTTGVATTATVALNGGTAVNVDCGSDSSLITPVTLLEDIHAIADQAEHELTVAVTSSATGAVTVNSIGVVEWPMPELVEDLNGVLLERERPTGPIDVFSIGAVSQNGAGSAWGAINAGRRAGMHCFARRSEGTGITTTSTTFVTVYTANAGPPLLGRYLYSGDTTRSLRWKAYASVTGGATLTIQATMVSGDVQSVTTTSAVAGWLGAPATLAVDAEDMTASDGRRSARDDLLKLEMKVSSGLQTGSLWAFSCWEPLAI